MARKMSGYEYIRDGHYRVKVIISSDHLKMKAVPNDKPCTAFSQSVLALHTHTHKNIRTGKSEYHAFSLHLETAERETEKRGRKE